MIYYSSHFRDTNTTCPYCKIEMQEGIAIDTGNKAKDMNVCTGFGRPHINNETLHLVECLKCTQCGHSDDLVV